MRTARRDFLATAGLGLAGLAAGTPMAAAGERPEEGAKPTEGAKPAPKGAAMAEDVSATEDLMREHGVLRRILLIYETALAQTHSLGQRPVKVPAEVFHKSSTLIRKFVEDYHEKLEENFIFPLFEKRREMLPLVATLRKQHQAGRKLTDIVLGAKADEPAHGELWAAIARFIRMYGPHAAREDTVLFPALHKILTAAEMDKLGDQFEDEENRLFGKEGFEHVVAQVAEIEKRLGILDLDQFTPKP